jgi:transposase
MDDRKAFEAIVHVLRTGIQWNTLPRELGASSTVHDRFKEWSQAGFFKALWQAGLSDYAELEGIQWEWQTTDGEVTKAPFVKAAVGAGPTSCGTPWGRTPPLPLKRDILSKPSKLDLVHGVLWPGRALRGFSIAKSF